MYAVLDKLRLYGWNRRVFTDDDYRYFCSRDGVITVEAETGWPGQYLEHRGYPFIVLSPSLSDGARLWVSFHELAHFWLHSPGTQFLYAGCDKVERQADLIASCALIPVELMKQKTIWEIQDAYNYPAELCLLRCEILRSCGM